MVQWAPQGRRPDWWETVALRIHFALLACLCWVAPGCSESDDNVDRPRADAAVNNEMVGDGGPLSDASTTVDGGMQSFEKGTWQTVYPGGETICSRGDPYRFYYRHGDPKKLVVYFQGGGACWNQFTCSVADAIFSDKVYEPEDLNTLADSLFNVGIFDTSADGLFKDWSIVYVPYCTGDVHWGNATVEYTGRSCHSPPRLPQHEGRARVCLRENCRSRVCVRDRLQRWRIRVHFLNSARVATQYPDAIVSVLADSGRASSRILF